MRWWEEIRSRVLRHGVGERQIMRETGTHWTTPKKTLTHAEPPEYGRDPERPKPKPEGDRRRMSGSPEQISSGPPFTDPPPLTPSVSSCP